jgi:hypothetical protein
MQRGKQHQFAFPSSRRPTQWLYIVLRTVRISHDPMNLPCLLTIFAASLLGLFARITFQLLEKLFIGMSGALQLLFETVDGGMALNALS